MTMQLAYAHRHGADASALADDIRQLVVMETHVVAAYQAVDELIDDAPSRAHMRFFRRSHERTVCVLLRALGRLGPSVQAADEGLADVSETTIELFGDGSSPFEEMWLNEDEIVRAYEAALERTAEPFVRHALVRGLEAARGHRAWLSARGDSSAPS